MIDKRHCVSTIQFALSAKSITSFESLWVPPRNDESYSK
jgi:hypothetical protein